MQVQGGSASDANVNNDTVSQASATFDATDLTRNIVQTHAEYPIIKMVPDTVVYIDGLPYLVNDYIGAGGVFFNFNDYVTTVSGAVDIGSWIPSCSINLSIPNDLKYMLQAPGGQRILKTMCDVKVFTKGYYLTPEGESVYHRVFWGVLTNVTTSDNRKTLEVSLSCMGIMHLFDLMQFNKAVSVQTSQATGSPATPMSDKASGLSALEAILATFMSPLSSDVLDSETIAANNAHPTKTEWNRWYADKWNTHLMNLRKGVRLFGLVQKDIERVKAFEVSEARGASGTETGSARAGNKVSTKDEIERLAIMDNGLISSFLPNYSLGNLDLLQSSVQSRLARIQAMVELLGWEGYQDLDGSIVIKPPLYNLDCMLTNCEGPNPFVINLPEVIGAESEVEDASQVRLTRLAVHGSLGSSPLLGGTGQYIPHATFLDPGLVRQFGLRQEPSKEIPFVANNPYALYAFAVSEMTKINKHWRTYNVTIPLRPELRLGFTIFVPHLDIYVYVENISWNYQRGGTCTTTLSGTNVRCRELFAKEKIETAPTGEQTKQWIYTSVPNLEYVWTSAARAQPIDAQNRITSPEGSIGTAISVLKSDEMTPGAAQLADGAKRMGQTVATASDDKTNCWRVSAGSLFLNKRPVDKAYYDDICHKAMPYTDAKGYTLLRPFPWGRFLTLEKALDVFTRSSSKQTSKLLPHESSSSSAVTNDVNGFLMAALGTPSVSSTDPTKQNVDDVAVETQLTALKDFMQDDTSCFVLSFKSETDQVVNPYNGDDGEGDISSSSAAAIAQGPNPSPGEEVPPLNPIQRATAYVTAITGPNIESEFIQ